MPAPSLFRYHASAPLARSDVAGLCADRRSCAAARGRARARHRFSCSAGLMDESPLRPRTSETRT